MDVEKSSEKKSRSGLQKLYKAVMFALVVAAVTKELQKDPADREWHGTVAGFVPYEFRIPTFARAKERLWDPEAEHVIGPQVFGVGWTVNVGRVVAVVKDRFTD
ncbi:DUF5808 domain-containing protein [Isoptericola haloaureus]|uniref:DUF5808 domain-containing protein n=1 Tax=Isoptericola haloaureus TaxID=1542902 RepID=A0ABU7Z7N5_9MICO